MVMITDSAVARPPRCQAREWAALQVLILPRLRAYFGRHGTPSVADCLESWQPPAKPGFSCKPSFIKIYIFNDHDKGLR